MSVIDLLKSPLAIAGIVGSVAIGGGLTVYVVRDGTMPGQSAPAAEAFPGKFMVNVKYTRLRDDSESDKKLQVAYSEKGTFGPPDVYVFDTVNRPCSLMIDRQKGCILEIYGRPSIIVRINDDLPSTVSIKILGQTRYFRDHVSWADLRSGVSGSNLEIRAF